MIELVEDRLDIDTYLELRQSVQFRELTRDQAKKGLSNSLYTFVIQEGYEGTTMMFDLMCAKGREEFYKKHGFIARPTKDLGPGMIQFIQIGSDEQ